MGISILTVDDSTSMRRMVAETLRLAGHEVTEASDGVDGLNKAQSGRFDVVVTDVNMPRLDGIGLVRELRKCPDYASTPILMLSTESGTEVRARAREAGATGWIPKPFDPEQLVGLIGRVTR